MQGFSAKSQIYLKFLRKRLAIGATMRRYNKYLFTFFDIRKKIETISKK